MKLDDIRALLTCKTLIEAVDEIRGGHARISTALRYPDGASIELFVKSDSDAWCLSDFGQTTAWLLDVQVKPWLSSKRRTFVKDILHVHRGVLLNGGAFELPFASPQELEPSVLVLAQACLRVSDLVFTRRTMMQSSFSEVIEEVIVDTDLEYEHDVELRGQNEAVRVDYLVQGASKKSALIGWSSGAAAAAHQVANDIFRKWYELRGSMEQRVTVYDDSRDVYSGADIARLKDFSDVLPLSDRASLAELLAA